jgi:peptidoglycan/LPS O-acetylase OafA/YrhL
MPPVLAAPASSPALAAPAGPSPTEGHGRMAFRPDIEGLRGIAVLLVVAYHAGIPGVSGGFVGVDVFFVLSGYLITALLVAEIGRTGKVDLARFYARRARRLLPASLLALAVTIAAGALVYSPMEALHLGRSAIATAVYASNVYFQESIGYFAPAAGRNPLLHTWSLAVEEQFYLVWPMLILLAGRRSRARLAYALAGLCVVSLLGCVWLTSRHPPIAFYGTPLRAWEFGVGGLACLLPAAAVGRRQAGALAWAGAAAVLAAAVLFSHRTPFPGIAAALPVLGTAALLVAAASAPRGMVARGLGTPGPQLLGRLSYSWYLWHWPALVITAALVPGLSLGGRVGVALLSLAVAWAAYTWVERPIRESRFLAGRPRLTLQGAAVLTLAGLTLAGAWYASILRQRRSPEQARFVAASLDRSRAYADGCMNGGLHDARVRECTFGDTTSAVTVVLFGDSHAAQWLPAVERAALERGWKVVTMLKGLCPASRVTVFNPHLRRASPECAQWRASALLRIAELRPAAVVQASWDGYVRHPLIDDSFARLTTDQWGEGTRSTLRALTAGGTPVLLVRDAPSPGVDVPVCLSRGSTCTANREQGLHEGVFQAERAAARGLPVAILDLTDRFCDATLCRAEADGVIRYFDANHITASYAAALSPAFAAALDPLVSRAPPKE